MEKIRDLGWSDAYEEVWGRNCLGTVEMMKPSFDCYELSWFIF